MNIQMNKKPSIRGHRINNILIDAINIPGQDTRKPKCHDMFTMTYPNVCLLAKKKSGKTNCLYHILKHMIGPETDIYMFVSTANRDATYKDMIKYFEGQGNKVDVKLGIYDKVAKGKRKVKVNQLEQLIDSLRETDGEKKQKGKGKKSNKPKTMRERFDRPERPTSMFDRKITFAQLGENHLAHRLFRGGGIKRTEPIPIKAKPKKKKGGLLVPERVFIFDDLSNELNDPQVARLLKANRHFKGATIVSTQFVNDLPPSARSQFDAVIAFKGHTPNKVETIRKMTDSSVSEDEFQDLYKYATAEPYSFLYCNARDNTFRKNFNEELEI